MSVYDLLTETDFKAIDAWRREYVRYDKYEDFVSSRELLKLWAEHKDEFLSDLFSDSLIKTFPFSYEMKKETLCENMEEKVLSKYSSFFKALYAEIWRDPYAYNSYLLVKECLSPLGLVENKQFCETFDVQYWSKEEQKVKSIRCQKGSKVIRTLTKLASIFLADKTDDIYYSHLTLNEIINAHSLVLNQKCISGELCLSIHPLDYMTMSDNLEGWSSCMNWEDNGEYCMGTVEMMNSKYVVVAYLKSTSNYLEFGEGNTWNSKKWRTLCTVSQKCISTIKGYPYENEQLNKICVSKLMEMIPDVEWAEPIHHDEIGTVHNISARFVTDLMYNDTFRNANDTCIVFSKDFLAGGKNYKLNYSGPAQCMCCGNTQSIMIDSPSSLACGDCIHLHRCECCGELIPEGEEYYSDNGVCLCQSCWDEESWYDDYTEEYVYSDERGGMVYVALDSAELSRDIPWGLRPYMTVAEDDLERSDFLEDFGEATYATSCWGTCVYFIDISNCSCSPSVLSRYFGVSNAEELYSSVVGRR